LKKNNIKVGVKGKSCEKWEIIYFGGGRIFC
jgi:hypothetical protein